MSALHNRTEPEPFLSGALRDLTAVIVATMTRDGELLDANGGFLNLMESAGLPRHSTDIRDLFVSPRFDELAGRSNPGDATLHRGILSLGRASQTVRSLSGVIYSQGSHLVLLAEYDVAELERLNDTVLRLNKDLAEAQRKLKRAHTEVERQVRERTMQLSRANRLLQQEIAERKGIEEALVRERDRAQTTLSSIADAVITTDPEGIVGYMNPVAEALTGWPLAQAIGRPSDEVFQLVEEKNPECALSPLDQCLRHGQVAAASEGCLLLGRHGEQYAIEYSAAPIRASSASILGGVLVFRDITESRRIARKIAHDATHDALTGLVNRREFQCRLEGAVASSREYGACHALCYLDLDQFKVINDTAGHSVGDELLKHTARLLAESVRERDTLARIGGDEFALLLHSCPPDRAVQIAETLVATLRSFRFAWEGRLFGVGASIGLVPVTDAATDAGELLKLADVACYTAKDLGRNRVHVYQAANGEPIRRHREILLAADLRDALDGNRFLLYCQPIVPLSPPNSVPHHYEFLIRLRDVDGSLLLPGSFIPSAERYGLMTEIDRWVIRTVLHRCAKMYGRSSQIQIAINLSGNSLDDESLLGYVQEQFASSGFPAKRVCFEITETAAIHHFSNATRFIRTMKRSGCRFALDDFGSGVSSFTYLKRLPVDYLKIEGSLVKGMIEDPADRSMVTAINQIGHAMSMETIAEYVQDPQIAEQLRELGVDYGQGYALGSLIPL